MERVEDGPSWRCYASGRSLAQSTLSPNSQQGLVASPTQQHEVKISTQCIYTMNVSKQFIYFYTVYLLYLDCTIAWWRQLATLGQANKGGRCWYKVVPPSTIMQQAELDNRQAIHILCFYLEEDTGREVRQQPRSDSIHGVHIL